jgi:hypothetical protein
MFANVPLALIPAAVQEEEGGLTFSTILERLPTDPAAIFVLLLVVGAIVAIWWAGKPRA